MMMMMMMSYRALILHSGWLVTPLRGFGWKETEWNTGPLNPGLVQNILSPLTQWIPPSSQCVNHNRIQSVDENKLEAAKNWWDSNRSVCLLRLCLRPLCRLVVAYLSLVQVQASTSKCWLYWTRTHIYLLWQQRFFSPASGEKPNSQKSTVFANSLNFGACSRTIHFESDQRQSPAAALLPWSSPGLRNIRGSWHRAELPEGCSGFSKMFSGRFSSRLLLCRQNKSLTLIDIDSIWPPVYVKITTVGVVRETNERKQRLLDISSCFVSSSWRRVTDHWEKVALRLLTS